MRCFVLRYFLVLLQTVLLSDLVHLGSYVARERVQDTPLRVVGVGALTHAFDDRNRKVLVGWVLQIFVAVISKWR